MAEIPDRVEENQPIPKRWTDRVVNAIIEIFMGIARGTVLIGTGVNTLGKVNPPSVTDGKRYWFTVRNGRGEFVTIEEIARSRTVPTDRSINIWISPD